MPPRRQTCPRRKLRDELVQLTACVAVRPRTSVRVSRVRDDFVPPTVPLGSPWIGAALENRAAEPNFATLSLDGGGLENRFGAFCSDVGSNPTPSVFVMCQDIPDTRVGTSWTLDLRPSSW